MRIDQIAVDGFGLLRDQRIAPAPGLTVIRGENEAGKSTLLAFIRAILFGFDPKSPAALAGGRRGGWLIVTTGDGRPIRVERYGTTGGSGQLRLLGEDGDEIGSDGLGRILQGVERAVYRNIFAFGLSELTEFETLTGPAIADRIYGAGMGTGATSVVDIENAFEKARGEIFAKRGRIPRVNVLLTDIDELEARIEAINPPEAFRIAGDRRTTLDQELSTLSVEAEKIGVERHRLERLRDGWSSWVRLEAASARLAEVTPDAADGTLFAIDLLERLGRSEQQVAGVRDRQVELDAARVKATGERDAVSVDESLLAAQPAAEALIADLAEARADRARLAEQERDLADRSAQIAEALRRLGPGWDEARAGGVDDSVEAQGAISGPFRTSLEASERDLASARRDEAAAEENLADGRVDAAALGAALEPGATARRGTGRSSIATWALVGLLVGLIAGEGALLLHLDGLAAFGLALVLTILVAVAGSRLAPAVSRPAPSAPANQARERVDEGDRRIRVLEQRSAAAADRLAEATRAQEVALDTWRSWLTDHGLPADVDRETANRLIDGVRAVRTGLAAAAAARERWSATADRLTQFEERAATFLAGLDRPVDDPLAELEVIRRDLAATRTAANVRQRAAGDLARIDASAAVNESGLSARMAEHEAILAEGGARDASELRMVVAAANRRAEIAADIGAAEETLAALSGSGEALAAFESDLAAAGALARIEDELAVVVERSRTLEASRAAVLEELGAAREAIATLERSAEGAELRQARADRIAELRVLAESWSVTSIALAILRRTRERYEREHRPEVLRAAEQLLGDWTGGRYTRILAPLGKQVQELERNDGVIVPLGGLSTGTAQQLYLALRFGLVDHFARQAESLPVVMDDILVNFDPQRAERAARSIEDLATRHQVLYFTCHPGTPLRPETTVELPVLGRS